MNIALFIIAAVSHGFADALAHGLRWEFPPTHFLGKESWRRKYKNLDPSDGPAFIGSTTFLVFVTDGWHLSKAVTLFCLLQLVTQNLWITISLYVIYSFIFEGSYILFRNKTKNQKDNKS